MTVIDPKPNPNISTFRPLDQQINSNIKYNGIDKHFIFIITQWRAAKYQLSDSSTDITYCSLGNGYMGCNGYVPCQPEQLRPDLLAERIEGAMPCHNYNDQGEQPAGCWWLRLLLSSSPVFSRIIQTKLAQSNCKQAINKQSRKVFDYQAARKF